MSAVRAVVDAERCAGHGACVTTCPEVFAMTADGFARATTESIPENLVAQARRAARECPEQAIEVLGE